MSETVDVQQGQIASMQDRLCNCNTSEVGGTQDVGPEVEGSGVGLSGPIDLTMVTDREEVDEDQDQEQDEVVMGRSGDLSVIEETDSSLVPIESTVIVSRQRCVRSSGPFKMPAPYWIATGVRRPWISLPERKLSERVTKRKGRSARVASGSSEFGSCDDLEWGWHSDAGRRRRSGALVGGSGHAPKVLGGLELLGRELLE
jgi:hypothetical protein